MAKSFFLGIHLGHDASASVISEGRVLGSVVQERLTGARHDYGINVMTIRALLKKVGLKISDISFVGVSSTQCMPALIQTPNEIRIKPRFTNVKSDSSEEIRLHGFQWLTESGSLIVDEGDEESTETRFRDFIHTNLVLGRKLPPENYSKFKMILFADPLFVDKKLNRNKKRTHEVIENVVDVLRTNTQSKAVDLSEEIEIEIDGYVLEGFYFSHHACHAASNLSICSDPKLIITHDGGSGFQSGGVWKFENGELDLLSLHELELGKIYDYFALKLGLGSIGGAGKLMGLAAYGKGRLFPEMPFHGTVSDLHFQLKHYQIDYDETLDLEESLWRACLVKCKSFGIPVEDIGDPSRVLDVAQVEIANFIQRLVELSFLNLSKLLSQKLNFEKLGISGGFALNCPTNTSVYLHSGFKEIVIEPHCEDGGCSVGAAMLGYLKVTGRALSANQFDKSSSEYGYKGLPHSSGRIVFRKESKLQKNSQKIAELLAENKVIGICWGESEVGPRALGHRSIIANPKYLENWARVNNIKNRELWRPFAPAVLEENLFEFFENGPKVSPFMLFNYEVKKEHRNELFAITHRDFTSRVQTVDSKVEPLYSILNALKGIGLPPVVLNTSFNGPGQPIIQYRHEALQFLRETQLDHVFTENGLISK